MNVLAAFVSGFSSRSQHGLAGHHLVAVRQLPDGGRAAAEIHRVNGKYYYAATFVDRNDLVDVVPRRYNVNRHQTMILVSDKVEGPYKPANPDPQFDLLPHSWTTIDGTIWYEDGVAYFVFCHEWLQTIDGTMEYAKLAPDLSRLAEKPTVIFRASEAPWALEMVGNGEMTYGLRIPGWVTDGPELFRTKTGKPGMLWSSWGAHRFIMPEETDLGNRNFVKSMLPATKWSSGRDTTRSC